ncbi:hypothetical protein ABIF66_004237 [Bradyrhizobium japonicum]|uniref:Type II toxin-antitoxin system HicA family toxin n=1 Tax=Bradyrhizobium barranii subsp. barranii TaxID=2823807 RepID=A0A7Z0QG43_9BRAD|nr:MULTISPECIES: hypothetical protein [Bradyrhizobium]UGX90281.1 hypothetical protein G6321_00031090 [Bradyrhizobium barranii subsp. barranii]UQE01125.1 hypothetical protein JEY30_13840 [Bradyrhizobium japonicum]
MRKLVREVVTFVRNAGGSDVWVSQGGKHTRINFTDPSGRKSHLLIHRGETVTTRYAAMIRSQLRRKIAP